MRMRATGLFSGAILYLCVACSASAQSTSAGSEPRGQEAASAPAQSQQSTAVSRIAPGSVIPVRLDKTVDAKKVKTGDEVEAEVTQDLKAVSGDLVMARDTKVMGHITESQARTKEQKESQVGIAFDRAVMKDGRVEQLPMSIQAVIAPPSRTRRPDNAADEEAPATSAAPGAGMGRGSGGERPGQMGPGASPQTFPSPQTGGDQPGNISENDSRRSVTMNTQGIVGISNYSLSTSGDADRGSVVSSEKSNVKLESGTLMLLRVNQ